MNKNYETPTIQIIEFKLDVETAGASTIINYPWQADNNGEFFE